MGDTDLQLAKQKVSEQRQRGLRQQGVMLSLRRDGGKKLADAVALLNSMRAELTVMETELERLILNA